MILETSNHFIPLGSNHLEINLQFQREWKKIGQKDRKNWKKKNKKKIKDINK